ncbi:MAG: sulfatase-like hydrolase/transferase [bacterium]
MSSGRLRRKRCAPCPTSMHDTLHRRDFLRRAIAGTAGLLLPGACSRAPQPGPVRPNVVLFVTDDQSWSSIGYASGGSVQTPHLDRLSARGVRFERAYANSMPCIPSRASMLTGLHHHRWPRGHRVSRKTGETYETSVAEGSWTWASALRAAGYATALIGKMHLDPPKARLGFEQMQLCELRAMGKDEYARWLESHGVLEKVLATTAKSPLSFGVADWPLSARQHRISWVRDRTIEFLDAQRRQAQPFLLVVSFLAPHAPYDPIEPFASMYAPDAQVLPTDRWQDLQAMPPTLAAMRRLLPRSNLPADLLRRALARYLGLVSQVDDSIGTIAGHIDLERTLVVFTSDHGDYLGRRDCLLKSPLVPFDAVARVPMFACGAGVPEGLSYPHPVSLVDIAPTLLRAAAIDVPADLDGRALQECFTATGAGPDRTTYCFGADGFDMITRGNVKYFQAHQGDEEMLFDLAADPDEWSNVVADHDRRHDVAALRQAMAQVRRRPPSTLPAFSLSALPRRRNRTTAA